MGKNELCRLKVLCEFFSYFLMKAVLSHSNESAVRNKFPYSLFNCFFNLFNRFVLTGYLQSVSCFTQGTCRVAEFTLVNFLFRNLRPLINKVVIRISSHAEIFAKVSK